MGDRDAVDPVVRVASAITQLPWPRFGQGTGRRAGDGDAIDKQ